MVLLAPQDQTSGMSAVAAAICVALALGCAACATDDLIVADRRDEASPARELPVELYCPSGKGETVSYNSYILPDAEGGSTTPEAAAHALSDVFDDATATFVEPDQKVFMVDAAGNLIGIIRVTHVPSGWLAAGGEACAEPNLFTDTVD